MAIATKPCEQQQFQQQIKTKEIKKKFKSLYRQQEQQQQQQQHQQQQQQLQQQQRCQSPRQEHKTHQQQHNCQEKLNKNGNTQDVMVTVVVNDVAVVKSVAEILQREAEQQQQQQQKATDYYMFNVDDEQKTHHHQQRQQQQEHQQQQEPSNNYSSNKIRVQSHELEDDEVTIVNNGMPTNKLQQRQQKHQQYQQQQEYQQLNQQQQYHNYHCPTGKSCSCSYVKTSGTAMAVTKTAMGVAMCNNSNTNNNVSSDNNINNRKNNNICLNLMQQQPQQQQQYCNHPQELKKDYAINANNLNYENVNNYQMDKFFLACIPLYDSNINAEQATSLAATTTTTRATTMTSSTAAAAAAANKHTETETTVPTEKFAIFLCVATATAIPDRTNSNATQRNFTSVDSRHFETIIESQRTGIKWFGRSQSLMKSWYEIEAEGHFLTHEIPAQLKDSDALEIVIRIK
ncbi:GATA zinc finger domain-containing protein 10-like [Teleopsis dalmanni]|uniref:GATA zinc finger domain-containing protein 10-like n=1 Tax=Teleopsis dalmanni TaxID=139649 RepID=UPI0018CE59A7|nr:GATA zinc finger domain-containing protein 10-like [Teleopsis dalmanni]